MTVEQIQAEFPEFANTNPTLISAKIADATAIINPAAFGDRFEHTMKYLACHLVALAPGGEFARLDANKEPDGARTLYEREYLRALRALAGPMVV